MNQRVVLFEIRLQNVSRENHLFQDPLATETSVDIVPTIELDYAVASGRTSDPESELPTFTAAESAFGAVIATILATTNSTDEAIL